MDPVSGHGVLRGDIGGVSAPRRLRGMRGWPVPGVHSQAGHGPPSRVNGAEAFSITAPLRWEASLELKVFPPQPH